jgi:hypothetical protein
MDKQYHGQKKKENDDDKQWPKKHYTENERLGITITT